MHRSDVILYDRLGLGSFTHSRDAELQALLLGIQLLNRTPPPLQIKEVVLVSDSALALRQLQRAVPQSGHAATIKWHSRAQDFLSGNPHVTLRVMWGPSKETLPLQNVDLLAKHSRTSGNSLMPTLRNI